MDESKLVKIVPLRKGREGQGLTYYAIQRVSDECYMDRNGRFTQSDLHGSNTFHFNTEGDAVTQAEAAGYEVEN